jgi:glutamine synthetase type III
MAKKTLSANEKLAVQNLFNESASENAQLDKKVVTQTFKNVVKTIGKSSAIMNDIADILSLEVKAYKHSRIAEISEEGL